MTAFNRIFFRGLITLLPIAITIYIVYSAVIILENLLGTTLRKILPENAYIPGLGFMLTLILIFAFGLMLNSFILGKVISSMEKRLTSVPFVKAIYSPLRDLMNLFNRTENPQEMGSVVLVKIGDTDARALGLVTRENFKDLPLGTIADDKVAVYFPLSYGLGGFTFLVPRKSIQEIEMPIEKAMSLAITGWVKAETKENHESHS
ncbi:MAG: DUF502 domain-containing protein [Proteobacteria bacterium]|jgi:uncharacterized membrane protein|nr:DUF502 domain-containing protein [Pseudomonadota bacterium]